MATNDSETPNTPPVEAAPVETNANPSYVVVDHNGEIFEIPTEADNSLTLVTLTSAVTGATGLKYKNPKTGANRTVLVDSSGTRFLPPADGWDDKVFQPIVVAALARGSDVSVKRRKMGDSGDEDDSEGEGRLGRKRLAESSPMVDRRPVDLIVLGINFKTTDEAFKAYFETFGQVAFAEVKKNAEGASKGFGFVQMATMDDQEKVLGSLQHSIDGRRCEVKLPDQRSQFTQFDQYAANAYGSPHGHGKRAQKPIVNKVFVGRLVEKISDSMLREFFDEEAKKLDPTCTINDVFIPSPFRGFGFVTFSSTDVADRLCRRGNYVVDGVSVAVSLAVPKDSSPYGASSPAAYHNEQGFAYGYGKGGAGYPSPGYRKNEYANRFEQPYGYDASVPRHAYEQVWAQQQQQSSSTPVRPGAGGQWMPPRPGRRGAASPGIHAPAYPPQPLIPHPTDSVVPSQIANGLDALDLNQKTAANPEAYHAAWSAFYTTLQAAGGSAPMPARAPPTHWQKN